MFNTHKMLSYMHKIYGAHGQFVGNHNVQSLNMKEWWSHTLHKPDGWIKFLSPKDLKNKKKYLSNVLKIGGLHVKYINNHYAKLKY